MSKLPTYTATTVITCLLILYPCLAGERADAIQPDPAVPQLKVLEGYAGRFDLRVTTESLRHIQGECEGKWILGGRYLEQTVSLRTEDQGEVQTTRTMMTYDAKAGLYRQWLFASGDGFATSGTGTWNDAQKMMTWSTTGDEKTIQTVADFSQLGTESWHLTVSTSTGTTELDVRGTNTRAATSAK